MAGFTARGLFLLLLCVGTANSIPLLTQFAVDQTLALGVGILTDDLTGDDDQSQLEDISLYLDAMNEKIKQGLALNTEIKEQGTVNLATVIELELNVFLSRYTKLVKTRQYLNQSNDGTNSTEEFRLFKENADKFMKDTEEIPHLLNKLHNLIVGSSKVAAGRSAGLACDFVSHVFRQLESVEPHSEENNFNMVLKKIYDYRDTLMTMQVLYFQLRNISCSDKDVLCKYDAEELEEHLQEQYGRFEECVPGLVKNFTQSLSDVAIVDSETKQVLYNLQYSSLVVEGLIDWDRITTPQPQGLICPLENSSITWYFVNATSAPGQNEFYLKSETGCILGFDQKFIHYTQDFPTFWASGDKIDRNNFLICSQSDSAYGDAGLFRILPKGSAPNTRYQLKEIKTGKYLNVREKKTSVLEEVDKRLVVTLLLNKLETNSWIITTNDSSIGECKEIADSSTATSDAMLIVFIVIPIIVLLIILVPVVCWCRKRRVNNLKSKEVIEIEHITF